MWLFGNKAKASSWLDELEDSLINRPWEWCFEQYEETSDHYLENKLSGVVLQWHGAGCDYVDFAGRLLPREGSDKVLPIIFKHLAIRSKFAARIDFDETAKTLAKAVMAGEATAAYGLADHIIENCKRD